MNLFANIKTGIKNLLKPNLTTVSFGQTHTFYENEISPDTISSAQLMAQDGRMQQITQLLDLLIARDDNIAGDIDVRKEAAKTAIFELPEGLSKPQEEYFTNFLNKWLIELIDQAIDLKLVGVLFAQINYKKNTYYEVESFKEHPNHDIRIKNDEIALYIEDNKKTLSDIKFILKYRKKPVLSPLLKYYAFFMFALNNWASFMEIFGKPIRVGKYKPGTSEGEKNELWNMVQSAGTDLAAMISENTVVEFVEHSNTRASSDLYKDLLTFVSERATKRILGQVLTTTAQKTGSYAQGKVHELVRQDILAGDLRDASKHVSEICTLLNRINFNENEILIKLKIAEKTDLTARIAIDEKLNNMIEIEAEYFYKKYNIPEPKGGFKLKEIQQNEQQVLNLPFSKSLPVLRAKAEASKYEKQIQVIAKLSRKLVNSLKSYDDVKNLGFPFEIYTAFGKGLTDAILTAYVKAKQGKTLNAVNSVKNQASLFEIDWNMTDVKALHAFRSQAFEVAGVTSTETLEMLKNEASKAFTEGLTFKEFKQNATLKGFTPDNPYHLRTNFNTAVNNAYAARQWFNIQDEKDVFPYLQYAAIMDENTREEHAAWHGVIMSVDSDFWQSNYPPNGWNCRCSVEQLTANEATADPNFGQKPDPYTKADPSFQQNSGANMAIWKKWLEGKEVIEKSWKSLSLPAWKKMAKNKGKDLVSTDGLNRQGLYDLLKNHLNNRVLFDPQDVPVYLSTEQSKFDKFDGKNVKDLAKRFSYLNHLDDTLENPDEVWYQASKKRYRYMKKYDKNIMVLTDVENGDLTYFDIILSNQNTYVDNNRFGELIYSK